MVNILTIAGPPSPRDINKHFVKKPGRNKLQPRKNILYSTKTWHWYSSFTKDREVCIRCITKNMETTKNRETLRIYQIKSRESWSELKQCWTKNREAWSYVTKNRETCRTCQTKNKETWFVPMQCWTKNRKAWSCLTKNRKTTKNRESKQKQSFKVLWYFVVCVTTWAIFLYFSSFWHKFSIFQWGWKCDFQASRKAKMNTKFQKFWPPLPPSPIPASSFLPCFAQFETLRKTEEIRYLYIISYGRSKQNRPKYWPFVSMLTSSV